MNWDNKRLYWENVANVLEDDKRFIMEYLFYKTLALFARFMCKYRNNY